MVHRRMKVIGEGASRLTCYCPHQADLRPADVNYVLLGLRQCARFEPEELVDAVVLRGRTENRWQSLVSVTVKGVQPMCIQPTRNKLISATRPSGPARVASRTSVFAPEI